VDAARDGKPLIWTPPLFQARDAGAQAHPGDPIFRKLPICFHERDAGGPGGVDHRGGLAGVLGEGLLHQHVLPGGDRGQRLFGVPAVRGRHVDRLHVRIIEQGLVGGMRDADAVLAGEGLCPGGGAGSDGDDPLRGVRGERGREG
jgi:hypothetical protein